jgi:hypothetical protein
VFRNPIPLQKLQEIWKSQDKNFNPITPLSVTNETFFSLYNLGMRGK